MKPREQGDWGEMSAMQWLAFAGAQIAVPVGHTPNWDFIADFHGALIRVQSKTSRCYRNGRWDVTTCTRGGNQSWNGLVKKLNPRDRCGRPALVHSGTSAGRPESSLARRPEIRGVRG